MNLASSTKQERKPSKQSLRPLARTVKRRRNPSAVETEGRHERKIGVRHSIDDFRWPGDSECCQHERFSASSHCIAEPGAEQPEAACCALPVGSLRALCLTT
jgi:hypothetical protein